MMFGLTPDEYCYIFEHVVAPLQAQGAKAFCYGSRARGDHKTFSDLDIMVEADKDLAALVGQLQEQLTQSNFPYKVDLVEFKHFADAYKAGYLRDKSPFAEAG
jgi:predicted nucleotidyltransferase